MSNPQTKCAIELLQAADETGLPLPILKRHIERVGEKRVCDPQLTVLHRTGFDTDLYEAAAAGTLERVDRTILRHLLGLSPITNEVPTKVANNDPETGVYTFEVDYDQSIASKTAESERDPKSLAWVTGYATDEKFPDDRKGKRTATGRIMRFDKDKRMGQEEVERWARDNNKILACPKELIDFSKSFPRPALDGDMPLAAAGQFWTNANGRRYYLCLHRLGAERDLDRVLLDPSGLWSDGRRFLVLDPPQGGASK